MNKKIKILEVVGTMNMGGAETFLMNVLRNIDRNKFQLFFLTYGEDKYDYEDEINDLGGIIIRISKPKKIFDFNQINQIKNVIKNYNINIVHTHTYYNSIYSILAANKFKNVRIITHSHNTKPDPTNNIIKKLYYQFSKIIINKYTDLFLACGNEAGKSLFYNNDFEIIDNGIIIDKFKFSKEIRNKKRKELNISDEEISLLHVGRFDKQKNHEFLIDIFNNYFKTNKNVKLYLVGDGILKSNIKNKVNEYKLDKSVVFLNKRKDVNELFSAMDILLFPSLFEGLPVTLIEAQANGIPILASSNIDKDVNYTNTIKFLEINNNLDEWKSIINNEKNKRYINNYKILLNSKYNMKKNVKKLEDIYETINYYASI